jgi:uncharacterized cupredoxin-like copper-binding protein
MMTAISRLLPLAPLALALVACTPGPESPIAPGMAPVEDVDWSRAEEIEVTLVDFSFKPSRIMLEHGRPYRLHLENRGSGGHNFDAPDFFRSALLREDAATELREGKGAVELARDEVKDVYLVPMRAGTFPLECTHLLHAMIFGMTGEIEVR